MDLVWRFFFGRFDDPEVQRDSKFLPYKVVNKDGKPYIEVKVKGETKVFSPEEISAMVLVKMKETAEQYLGKKIKDAVITVPGTNLVLLSSCLFPVSTKIPITMCTSDCSIIVLVFYFVVC